VWTEVRRGSRDPDVFGVDPDLPFKGLAFIHDEVIHELAPRQGDELLLWDQWGAMGPADVEAAAPLVDEIAGLLLAADDGDQAAEAELAERCRTDDRLNPRGEVRRLSPYGKPPVTERLVG
jgi:hypothetical protein